MSQSEKLEALAKRLESDAAVLTRWGLDQEARVVRVCRSDLQEQLPNPNPDRLATLTDTWWTEADVLEEYGHDEEANAIRVCVNRLQSVLADTSWEDKDPDEAPTTASRQEGPPVDDPALNEDGPETPSSDARSESGRIPSHPADPFSSDLRDTDAGVVDSDR